MGCYWGVQQNRDPGTLPKKFSGTGSQSSWTHERVGRDVLLVQCCFFQCSLIRLCPGQGYMFLHFTLGKRAKCVYEKILPATYRKNNYKKKPTEGFKETFRVKVCFRRKKKKQPRNTFYRVHKCVFKTFRHGRRPPAGRSWTSRVHRTPAAFDKYTCIWISKVQPEIKHKSNQNSFTNSTPSSHFVALTQRGRS